MLQLIQVTKAFGPKPLFEGLSLQINPGSRYGLIGRNGCGKSTLLKLMIGAVTPEKGSIVKTPGMRIRYLSQEPQVTPENTLEAEMKSVFEDILSFQAEEEALIEGLGALNDAEREKALHRLDFIHRELDRLDARSMDARIGRTLKGLGFTQDQLQRKVGEYSGGWQMRINLAKILLEPTELLLLDEPTNHLDLDACEWLEAFLKDYAGAVVVVSHDRRFLDQVTTETVEVELGRLTVWPGNYTKSLALKAERLELQASAYEHQQKEIARQSAFVERFRASANRSTQAKSREKQLEKIERIELQETDQRRMSLNFQAFQPSGRQVLTLRAVAKGFNGNPLFKNLDADLQRGQRIFLLGPNGCGKTTLFRLILGLEPLDDGEIRAGHQADIGYFSQNQLETLDPALSVYDTLQRACPKFSQSEVRGLLARFLFSSEDVFKQASVLSGGEKSKLALAKLMAEGPNTLLLDEPTNHMDIAAKEVLEEAFLEYPGTVLCISHDRYFIQKLATHIWEIHEGRLLTYAGDYEYYLGKRDELRAQLTQFPAKPQATAAIVTEPEATAPAPSALSPLQARREWEKRLAKVEKSIMKLESEIAALTEEMNDPAMQQDYQALQTLGDKVSLKNEELVRLNAEWETLAEEAIS